MTSFLHYVRRLGLWCWMMAVAAGMAIGAAGCGGTQSGTERPPSNK